MKAFRVCLFASLAFGLAQAASATTVKWDFPREGCCHEGIPFADGRTGILVWGGGDTVNLTVGRGDLWDHRGGFPWTEGQNYTNIIALVERRDAAGLKALFSQAVPEGWNPSGNVWTARYNPYMLPLGRVTVKLGGAALASGELDTATGLGKLVLADRREIALAMSKARRLFAMNVPKGLEAVVRIIPATDFPLYADLLKQRGFKRAEKGANGFTWELPADKPVSLGTEKVAEADGETLYVWTRRDEPACCTDRAAVGFAGVADDSRNHWHDFWQEGARITVPDPEVQELFDFGMYKFGSMTDPDGFPAGLQGQWLEDDKLVPWNGDYHFNINVQECYSPAYRGGHFRNLMPLFRMVLSWRPLLRDNARKFAQIENGYVLPHSVDDRGVCIGGFWAGTIDHASTAWVASMMYRYVRYSGDVAFLKDGAYDFMKGAMNVYRAMMEEKDGRLSIPVGPSPEWGDSDVQKCVGRDPSFQLAAAHRLARDLVSAAERLGETPDPMWLDVEKRLPSYTKGPGGFQLFEGQPFVESHRHHSHMAGLYPFDTIDLADKTVAEDVKATYRTWVRQGTGLWSGWCVPWAAILHTHVGRPDAAVQTLRAWKAFYNNPGHGSLHDAFNEGFSIMSGRKTIMQMDGACAAVTAAMELMAHETNGKVEFFRGCPANWRDVSFENLALSDGTRVSGRRVNGRIDVWTNGVVQVVVGGTTVAVAASGDGECVRVPGDPKAARLSERVDRMVERFVPVERDGIKMRVERKGCDGYRQFALTMTNTGAKPVEIGTVTFLKDWTPTGVADGTILGDCDGSVAHFANAATYVGVEHPLAQLSVADGRLTARLERGYPISPGEAWTFRWVVGRYSSGQLRRDFAAYLNAERAHPYRVFPHYNSWYDLNIDRNSGPWDTRMNEAQCLDRMRRFRKELGDRGVFINSYVWDDGWDDFDTLWDFHPGFPNGFRAIADEAHRTAGESIGCWMSPCGGYGSSQAQRLRYVQSLGIVATNETLLRMSSPKYYAAFRDRVLGMIRDYDMNIFKFDRMGGGQDGAGGRGACAAEMEAIVRLVGEMRAVKPDVFVNATVGTWPSPFWLMYADSIWRGGRDFWHEGEGSSRQQWLTYRDNRVHDRFVVKNPLFPLNSVMLHGVIVSKYGPPKCEDLSASAESTRDFADEVWMSVGCGTDLQEYYVSPDEMHGPWWDILASGIRWLKANEATLADVHWIGGDPQTDAGKGEVYGYAAWLAHGTESKGIVLLRNPSGKSQTFRALLADLLEMPTSRRSDRVAAVSKAYGHDVSFDKPDSVGQTVEFKLGPFGMTVLNVGIGR